MMDEAHNKKDVGKILRRGKGIAELRDDPTFDAVFNSSVAASSVVEPLVTYTVGSGSQSYAATDLVKRR